MQLADAFPAAQNLGQRTAGPAAAGQLGIKNRMAGGNGRNPELRGAAEPDRVLPEEFFEGRHDTVCTYSIRSAPAFQAPQLGLVGAHEFTAEHLVEVLLRVTRELVLLLD